MLKVAAKKKYLFCCLFVVCFLYVNMAEQEVFVESDWNGWEVGGLCFGSRNCVQTFSHKSTIMINSLKFISYIFLYNKALRSHIFVCIYVSYSWPNGWTEFADNFWGKSCVNSAGNAGNFSASILYKKYLYYFLKSKMRD